MVSAENFGRTSPWNKEVSETKVGVPRKGWAELAAGQETEGVSATSRAVTEQTRGAEGQNVVVEGNLAREVGKRGKGN